MVTRRPLELRLNHREEGTKPYAAFESNFPIQPNDTTTNDSTPTKPTTLSNILKSTIPKTQTQNTQQQSNLANALRNTQITQTALPSIYHQANPFNFGQQTLPVQDTTALAKLLRTA